MLNTKSITTNLQLEQQQDFNNEAEFGQNQHGTTRCSASLQQQSANHDNTYRESTITTAAALSTTTASSPTAAAAARYLN